MSDISRRIIISLFVGCFMICGALGVGTGLWAGAHYARTGPRGPAGPIGAQGPPGPQAANAVTTQEFLGLASTVPDLNRGIVLAVGGCPHGAAFMGSTRLTDVFGRTELNSYSLCEYR